MTVAGVIIEIFIRFYLLSCLKTFSRLICCQHFLFFFLYLLTWKELNANITPFYLSTIKAPCESTLNRGIVLSFSHIKLSLDIYKEKQNLALFKTTMRVSPFFSFLLFLRLSLKMMYTTPVSFSSSKSTSECFIILFWNF